MSSIEIPPNFHGYVLNTPASTPGGVILSGVPSQGAHWDIWHWDSSGTPPPSFHIGGPAQQRLTRGQVFDPTTPATTIAPAIPTGGFGYAIKYKETVVGYVAFEADSHHAQWWMYETSYTPSQFLPTPSAQVPLEFTQAPPQPGNGWKATDY